MKPELQEVKKEIKVLEKKLKETSDLNEQWDICHRLKDLYVREYDLME